MKSLNDIKGDLLSYIAHEQVAFQFGDGLICFTKPGEYYDSIDIELELPSQVKQIKSYISEAENIKIVDKKSLFDDILGFAEFATWSNDQDILYLVDDCLLVCIPKSPNIQSFIISQ